VDHRDVIVSRFSCRREDAIMGERCAGRVALVTGASRGGTGTAIAIRLAAEGADVAVTARTESGLVECRDRIAALGRRCVVLPADMGAPDERATLVARTEAAFGPVDILVNSAAIGGYKPFDEWSAPELERMMQVNFWGPWQLMTQVITSMRANGRGAIVNLTSFSGEYPPGPPFPGNRPAKSGAAYGSSKAALNRLTVSVASECEGQGISVNALTPQAAISTPALARSGGWIDQVMFEPLETMAEAALALITGDPGSLTGRIAFSLQLLLELQRPVYDLHGRELVDGWQPADLRAVIDRQADNLASRGWVAPFDFHRRSSPSP
jgi:NAD(P)-dependent dehydrogenase (short-subunit alcohol dehydrogenase family)